MSFDFLKACGFETFFDGDDGAGDPGTNDGTGDPGTNDGTGDPGINNDGAGDPPPTNAGDPPKPGKVFTQTELNLILKREREKEAKSKKETIRELEELKKSKTMTEQDRAKLATRIESLQDELLTKAELAAKEKEKLKKTHEEEKKSLSQEKEAWRQRFTESEISRSIFDASAEAGAFSGEDIGSLLKPSTQLMEEMDDNGNPTGRFVPKVKFRDTDKDGKPVTLDLTVKEAVKRMKDTPERYGYLFKSTAQSGLGMDGGAGRRAPIDISKMTAEQYREYRKKLKGGTVQNSK